MKKSFKSFLKYVLFSGFLSVSAVAAPIASPGTSTVYSGTNSSLIYSPTVTSGSGGNCNFTLIVDQTSPGTYVKTIDLSSFANCGSNTMLVIKAAGGMGGGRGGPGGITTLKIPLSTFIQEYGTKVTFYYLVNIGGGGYWYQPPSWALVWSTPIWNIPIWTGGGGESLVSLNNWPWNSGIPLAIGGGGGGGNNVANTTPIIGGGGYGGGGGGGNDPGGNADGGNGGGYGFGGGCTPAYIGGWGCYGAGGNGYLGYGGTGGGYGGGAGYGGGSSGGISQGSAITLSDPGGGGGGFCNTSVGTCEASDWTNGGGNYGPGYVEIYIESE